MPRIRAIRVAVALAVLAAPQAAAGATPFGVASLSATPLAGSACPLGAMSCTSVLTPPAARAPAAGVVVAWSIRALPGDATVTLRAVRPQGGAWQPVATDATPRTIHGGAVERFPARVPVQAGDALAVLSARVPDALDPDGPGPVAVIASPFADGTAARVADAAPAHGMLIQGELEPDGDADGYGDETQDACLGDAARHVAPCAVALTVSVADAPDYAVTGDSVRQVFRVTSTGSEPATGVTVRMNPAGTVTASRGACTSACTIGDLAPGDAAMVTVTTTAGGPGVLAVTAAAATTGGAHSARAEATAVTTVTAASVAPPPTIFTAPPCVNLRRGTNDDEVLAGTDFGDRLQGRGGRDLLEGEGGGDCLEGGTGADVLDGGDGDDRLSGASGRDRLYGDAGDDHLEGGRDDDALSGGPGRDTLSGGAGRDRIAAGSGDDTVSARDGSRDVIDCGPGSDSARVDRIDRVRGCEHVSRR